MNASEETEPCPLCVPGCSQLSGCHPAKRVPVPLRRNLRHSGGSTNNSRHSGQRPKTSILAAVLMTMMSPPGSHTPDRHEARLLSRLVFSAADTGCVLQSIDECAGVTARGRLRLRRLPFRHRRDLPAARRYLPSHPVHAAAPPILHQPIFASLFRTSAAETGS